MTDRHLARLGVGLSITVTINPTIRGVIDAIAADAWVPIAYPGGGEAAVAETTHVDRGGALHLRRNLWP